MMNVRIATLADAPVLAHLLEDFNGPPMTPVKAAARMRACEGIETTVLAEIDGTAAGFACLRVIPSMSDNVPYAELTELYVDVTYRRQGIGRALMAYVETLARARGADEMLLLVSFNNPDGQAFYRALGYGDYALVMRRRL